MSIVVYEANDIRSLRGDYKILENKHGNGDFIVKIVDVFTIDGVDYATVCPINCDGFEREVPIDALNDIPSFVEDKQAMLNKFLETIRMCSCAGNISNNDLVELNYFKDEHGDEWVRPIFRNGVGKNGWYDVKVTGDSNMGIIFDVTRQFLREMW